MIGVTEGAGVGGSGAKEGADDGTVDRVADGEDVGETVGGLSVAPIVKSVDSDCSNSPPDASKPLMAPVTA